MLFGSGRGTCGWDTWRNKLSAVGGMAEAGALVGQLAALFVSGSVGGRLLHSSNAVAASVGSNWMR